MEVCDEWRPWTSDGCQRMGGYVTRYEGDFDYLTIRGAGHMVPAIKASAALAFMEAWITGGDYPIYDKDCKAPYHGNHHLVPRKMLLLHGQIMQKERHE